MSTSQHESNARMPIDDAVKRMKALHAQGHYQNALDISLYITRTHQDIAEAWGNAAVNYGLLRRWQDAIHYAHAALAHGCQEFYVYDTLAHGYGLSKQWDEVRRYGLEALNLRDRRFGGEPPIPFSEPAFLPPQPSMQTREHNVIAFSLFGSDSKYCETAVLNVQEQPQVYPCWICRFYVDGSVPENVINRLRTSGAQIVRVEGSAAQWPGPMWRLLALDDPQIHRILFRDADSLIARREAAAVGQWLTSGKRFHMMRDWGSHTELILAGLWGAVAGSLPPLGSLIERFLSAPLASAHFADQFFLRRYVWPYMRASLMQHDSMFGFMKGVPFPGEARPDDLKVTHVGHIDSWQRFIIKTALSDGSAVTWTFTRIETLPDGQRREQLICSYPSAVKNGMVTAYLPARYIQWLQQGAARVSAVLQQVPVFV